MPLTCKRHSFLNSLLQTLATFASEALAIRGPQFVPEADLMQ
jgi:hypothetical protein